jgi:hypothetical protein
LAVLQHTYNRNPNNKIDLKKIGVGFNLPNNVGSSLLEQLTVPSGNSKFDLVGFPDDTPFYGKDSEVI